jgi:maleate isomerase
MCAGRIWGFPLKQGEWQVADSWRARLGFLVPSLNAVLERDAAAVLPDGVSAHFARMKLTRDDEDQIAGLINYVPAAASDVADAGVGVIAFGCTTGSLYGGTGYDERIIEVIEQATGVRATTTSTAVLKGLRALGARRVTVVSPYEPWLNEYVRTFLEDNQIAVAAIAGFALPDGRDCEMVTPDRILQKVQEVDTPDTDAIFLSCTDFRGLEGVEAMEGALGKPVVTSNQATIWEALRIAGIEEPVPGFGVLLRGAPYTMAPATGPVKN